MHSFFPAAFSLLSISVPLLPMADIYVDQNAANCPVGTGTALDPVCTITEAIALASSGDTIRIAPGIYTENVVVEKDLELLGVEGAEHTILDGGGTGSVISSVSAASAAVTIDGLTIRNGARGVRKRSGSITIRNSTINNNSGVSRGAGIYCRGLSSFSLINSRVSENNALNSGGGLFVQGPFGPHSIENTTISGNSVGNLGGGCGIIPEGNSNADRVRFTNSTISGNHSSYSGGGVSSYSSKYITPGVTVASFVNTTITDNSASNDGGGVWAASGSGSYNPSFSFKDSIVAGNTAGSPSTSDLALGEPASSLGHNLIGTGGLGFANGVNNDIVGSSASPVDPLLRPLMLAGGQRATHVPLPGSPAIDAGNPTTFEPFDQRGVSRAQGAQADIGAVEVEPGYLNLCFGDGGDSLGCTNCPCSNNAAPGSGGGCLNSSGAGAALVASGDASVTLPSGSTSDLRFAATGLPANAFCILNSGDGLAPGGMANPCFGLNSGAQAMQFDGLRCAIVGTRRHGGRSADANGEVGVTNSPWGGEGGPPVGIAVAGGGFSAGQTRYFQMIHRDDPLLVCMRGLNTSQGVEVIFEP